MKLAICRRSSEGQQRSRGGGAQGGGAQAQRVQQLERQVTLDPAPFSQTSSLVSPPSPSGQRAGAAAEEQEGPRWPRPEPRLCVQDQPAAGAQGPASGRGAGEAPPGGQRQLPGHGAALPHPPGRSPRTSCSSAACSHLLFVLFGKARYEQHICELQQQLEAASAAAALHPAGAQLQGLEAAQQEPEQALQDQIQALQQQLPHKVGSPLPSASATLTPGS